MNVCFLYLHKISSLYGTYRKIDFIIWDSNVPEFICRELLQSTHVRYCFPIKGFLRFILLSFHFNAGLTGLVSLNVSNSRITSTGLHHLKTLKNLKSLTLEGCKVTANDIKTLQSTALPNLVSFRPA